MTKTRAEFLTGYSIRSTWLRGAWRCAAFNGSTLVAEVLDRDERVGLRRLVKLIYAIHCQMALAEHGWRCAYCGRSRPIEIHHKRFRSLGGTHRVENLEPVCWDCHRRIHARGRRPA